MKDVAGRRFLRMLIRLGSERIPSDYSARSGSSSSSKHARNWELAAWTHVVESNQIDVLALAVLRDLEEVDHALETRRSRQLWSDIRETDRQDRIDLDLTLFHPVAVADLYMGTHPNADAASDFAAPNPVAQALREDHLESLLVAGERRSVRDHASGGVLSRPTPRLSGERGSIPPGRARQLRPLVRRQLHSRARFDHCQRPAATGPGSRCPIWRASMHNWPRWWASCATK
jgi:hypothetical protein